MREWHRFLPGVLWGLFLNSLSSLHFSGRSLWLWPGSVFSPPCAFAYTSHPKHWSVVKKCSILKETLELVLFCANSVVSRQRLPVPHQFPLKPSTRIVSLAVSKLMLLVGPMTKFWSGCFYTQIICKARSLTRFTDQVFLGRPWSCSSSRLWLISFISQPLFFPSSLSPPTSTTPAMIFYSI